MVVAGYLLNTLLSGAGTQAMTPSSTHGRVADNSLVGELGERRRAASPAPSAQIS